MIEELSYSLHIGNDKKIKQVRQNKLLKKGL